MKECAGIEICAEWLCHMGAPEEEIMDLAANSVSTVPCLMPYITAFFMPRTKGGRPNVVPDWEVPSPVRSRVCCTAREGSAIKGCACKFYAAFSPSPVLPESVAGGSGLGVGSGSGSGSGVGSGFGVGVGSGSCTFGPTKMTLSWLR